jgi:hypothetical protein
MPRINVNLNDVEDQIGEVHPDGETLVRVVDSDLKDNKAGDAKYINWRLKALNTENNKPLYLMTSLKPAALWNLLNFYKGCTGTEEGFDPDGFDSEDLHGAELYVQVSQEIYEGQPQNRVQGPYRRAV